MWFENSTVLFEYFKILLFYHDLINGATNQSHQRLLFIKMNLGYSERIFYWLFLTILLFHLQVGASYFGTNSKRDDQCFCKVLDAVLDIIP